MFNLLTKMIVMARLENGLAFLFGDKSYCFLNRLALKQTNGSESIKITIMIAIRYLLIERQLNI